MCHRVGGDPVFGQAYNNVALDWVNKEVSLSLHSLLNVIGDTSTIANSSFEVPLREPTLNHQTLIHLLVFTLRASFNWLGDANGIDSTIVTSISTTATLSYKLSN